jgi:hypothetical protein
MGKLVGGAGVLASIFVGAVVWFVLDVIIDIAVLISFLAGGATLLVGVLLALFGAHATQSGSHSAHRTPLGAR